MSVIVKEVQDRKDLKTFIYLPEKIHKGHAGWVHPIYIDEWNYFNPKKNRAFTYSDAVMLLAYRGRKPIGRIMGIINYRYNEFSGEKAARFGYLETRQDEEAVEILLNRVEDWARDKGMERIIGPYGFTDQDPEGFLIEGFDSPVTIPGYYNFEWMPEMVEKTGYGKDIDYVVYKIAVPEKLPEFYLKIFDRVKRKGHFELLEFTKRKQLKPWVAPVLQLMNESYSGSQIYGYTPLEEDEMIALGKRYLPLLDPRFVKAVMRGDELVSFVLGMPNLAGGIRRARGRLFPFGILKIMREAKKTNQLDLLLGAIKEEYRGRGLDVMMGVAMLRSAREAGMKVLDTHNEMETNVKVRAEMERMGGVIYKRFRVYQKNL
jgi:predicted GNAT family acetyltransferase